MKEINSDTNSGQQRTEETGGASFKGMYLNPGNDGFSTIRNSTYVDKSGLIRLINRRIGTTAKLVCVSRPRRFGKSFAAKMLCAYYCRNCDSSGLFRGLEIEKDESFEKWLNGLDVISLDISGFLSETIAAGESVDTVVQIIRRRLQAELVAAYPNANGESLGQLLFHIANNYGNKFFFVIDEWDALFREDSASAQVKNEYMNLLRELFKNGSVTDACIAGAYITGILPIKKDGSESAISDFHEYTMLNPGEFLPYFGFSESEVKAVCEKNHMRFDEAKRWYDGYAFPGEKSLYNPYSVMMAMEYHRYGSYWRQSSATDVLSDYIGMDFDGLSGCVASLLGEIAIPVETGFFGNDIFLLRNKDDVLTLLIHLGYLFYNEEDNTVRIPNEEIRIEFSRSVREVKSTETLERIRESRQLIADTVAGNEDAVAREIEKVHMEETVPLFYNNEQALRSVIKLAYFSYRDYYAELEELPSGTGYADIVYIPKKGVPLPALLVELKWNRDAETAIEQIRRKHYPDRLLPLTGEILLVGISYQKDDPHKNHSCHIEKYSG